MKKFFRFTVTAIAVLSILMTSLALVSSAASPKITMSTGKTSNDQTELIITVSKGSDLATFQAAVKYDADKVSLVSTEYLSGDKNVSNTDTKGVVLVNDIWTESINDKTDIIRIVFSPSADGETTFTLEDIRATDSNDNPINFAEPVTAKVKVKANTPDAATDPSSGSGSGSGSGNSGIAGSTNGTSPNTGSMIASAAGICGAAVAAAAVVVVLKKKNKSEE